MPTRRHDDYPSRRKLREQPISRLFPNMITIAGLCCGLSSVRFAMLGKWEIAVGFILMAAIIDGMDGRVARMLGATSIFGAQLDSLSDFVCFGVAPVLILYMWQLNEIKGIGWAVVLFFAVCAALRLARFNTGLVDGPKQQWEKQFFTGVPSPAGGLLCLMPLIATIEHGKALTLPPIFVALHVIIVGTLMASRIPTFSGKQLRIKHEAIPFFMIICSVMLVMFIIEPWSSLLFISGAYLLSIFLSAYRYGKLRKRDATSIES